MTLFEFFIGVGLVKLRDRARAAHRLIRPQPANKSDGCSSSRVDVRESSVRGGVPIAEHRSTRLDWPRARRRLFRDRVRHPVPDYTAQRPACRTKTRVFEPKHLTGELRN